MSNEQNLKKWEKGRSGNPKGRPVGSRNLRNVVKDLLNSEETMSKVWGNTSGSKVPIEAIVYATIDKAIDGDLKATQLLFKYYDDGNQQIMEPNIALVQFVGEDTDNNS